jgi:hypothetical protein
MHRSVCCVARVTTKRFSLDADDVSLRLELYTAEGVSVFLEFMANTVNTEEINALGKGASPWFYYKATNPKIYYRCNDISDGLRLESRDLVQDLQLIYLLMTRYRKRSTPTRVRRPETSTTGTLSWNSTLFLKRIIAHKPHLLQTHGSSLLYITIEHPSSQVKNLPRASMPHGLRAFSFRRVRRIHPNL